MPETELASMFTLASEDTEMACSLGFPKRSGTDTPE